MSVWNNPAVWFSLSLLSILGIMVWNLYRWKTRRMTLPQRPSGRWWPWALLIIPFLVIIEVLLSGIHPPTSMWQFVFYLVPLLASGGLPHRDPPLKRNWALFVSGQAVITYGAFMVGGRGFGLRLHLTGLLNLLGAVLVFAMLFVIFREAKRAQA